MVKKIKVSKFHVSRVCEEAELEAAMMVIKEGLDKLKVPQALTSFDNELADLVVKRLLKLPIGGGGAVLWRPHSSGPHRSHDRSGEKVSESRAL